MKINFKEKNITLKRIGFKLFEDFSSSSDFLTQTKCRPHRAFFIGFSIESCTIYFVQKLENENTFVLIDNIIQVKYFFVTFR
jgi:hypothetical protein